MILTKFVVRVKAIQAADCSCDSSDSNHSNIWSTECCSLLWGHLIMSSWIFVTPQLYLLDRKIPFLLSLLKSQVPKKYVSKKKCWVCSAYAVFHFQNKPWEFYHTYSERTRENGFWLRQGRFRLEMRNVFSLSGWSGIWICFPGNWGSDHTWTCLRGFWIWHWVMWSRGLGVTVTALDVGLDWIGLDWIPTWIILWFYDSIIMFCDQSFSFFLIPKYANIHIFVSVHVENVSHIHGSFLFSFAQGLSKVKKASIRT